MRKYNGLKGMSGVAALAATLLAGCAALGKGGTTAAPEETAATPSSAPRSASIGTQRMDGDTGSVAQAMPAADTPVMMREEAPLRYVVKKGDTLWAISNHFLKEAWQWPEIWYVNGQLKNPHLIYPGDVLTLVYRDGRVMVERANDTDYLSPQVRYVPLAEAIDTIPLDAIRDFLANPRVVTEEELRRAPYVLSFVDKHVIEGAGSQVYLKNVPFEGLSRYAAVRLGEKYVDPDTREVLGWEAVPVGDIELQKRDEVSTGLITRSTREVRPGDRLIKPLDDAFDSHFYPHAPKDAVKGRIISVFDGVSQIGQYQIVALNRGSFNGMEPGHVLDILQSDRRVRDPYTQRAVALPDLYAGTLLVFKVEERVSYGLVMSAVREIHRLDRVEKPDPSNR